jgi:hypothetical protein
LLIIITRTVALDLRGRSAGSATGT